MDVKCPGLSPHLPNVKYYINVPAVPRLLCNYNRLLTRTISGFVWFLYKRPMPTHWWKGATDRG